MERVSDSTNHMWSDNETDSDLLGFDHLVAGLVSIADNDALVPATIGVFGDWGSGKSSLLRMAGKALSSTSETLVLTFNGWLFEGFGDAKSALMGSILDALASEKTLGNKAKNLALRLLRRVNWWRVAGSAVKGGVGLMLGGPVGLGAAVAGSLKDAADELKSQVTEADKKLDEYFKGNLQQLERRSITEFRADFAELLDETKRKRLVVIIDDLDRCLPTTIIETLEAIKLFLLVEGTVFIVGVDERLVQYAVRFRFPDLPGERADVGRDYLEKLIQFPVRIPPLGRSEAETYISLLLASIKLNDKQFEKVRSKALDEIASSLGSTRFADVVPKVFSKSSDLLKEELSLAQRIAPILASETLGNPRQCKRFLNTLMFRLEFLPAGGVVSVVPRALVALVGIGRVAGQRVRVGGTTEGLLEAVGRVGGVVEVVAVVGAMAVVDGLDVELLVIGVVEADEVELADAVVRGPGGGAGLDAQVGVVRTGHLENPNAETTKKRKLSWGQDDFPAGNTMQSDEFHIRVYSAPECPCSWDSRSAWFSVYVSAIPPWPSISEPEKLRAWSEKRENKSRFRLVGEPSVDTRGKQRQF